MIKALFCISNHKTGVTALLTEEACTLHRLATGNFLFFGGEAEQFPGLFNRLRSEGVPLCVLDGLDDHRNFSGLSAKLADLVRTNQPEYIQVQSNWQLALAWAAKRRSGSRAKILYTIHGYRHNYPVRSWMARALIGAALRLTAHKVFACSGYVKQKFWFLGKKVVSLPLGIGQEFFGSPAGQVDHEPRTLCFPGEFRKGKNQHVVIHTLARYVRETQDRSVRLVLPGAGRRLELCKALARRLEVAGNVEFPGQLDRAGVLAVYRRSAVVVVPTNVETFGLTIAEAMVLGKCVISRPVGVAVDLIQHGKTGYLFDDEDDLLSLFKTVLGDPENVRAVGAAAAEAAKDLHWERVCRRYLDFLGIARGGALQEAAGPLQPAPVAAGVPSVVHFISSYRVGLTITLSECAASLNRFDGRLFQFVSGAREQFGGLHQALKDQGVNVRVLEGLDRHRDFFKLRDGLCALFKEVRPEIVHVHTNWQLALAWLALRKAGHKAKLYYSVHGYRHNNPWLSPLARYVIGGALLLTCDRVLLASSFLMRKFWFLGRKRVFLFQGVESRYFSVPAPAGGGGKQFVFAGQFRKGKNQDLVIRALAKYLRATGDATVRVHLPGAGPERERCQSLARALGVADQVDFPGQLDRDAIFDLYRRCDFAISPANAETFGYCIAEPYTLGLVVLTRQIGVAEDLIRHGETGFMFDTADDLALLMQHVQSPSVDLVSVRRKVWESRDQLHWDAINRKYMDIITEDLQGPMAPAAEALGARG